MPQADVSIAKAKENVKKNVKICLTYLFLDKLTGIPCVI